MLTNLEITGVDPFVSWSTFTAPTIKIPKGMFLGGCFYTAKPFKPPCHISYISGKDEVLLGTWGIADADGQELGAITFTEDSPNIGHILSVDGEYAGCIKGKLYNANNRSVIDNLDGEVVTDIPNPLKTSDLATFLYSVYGEHVLNNNSLILDCCICSYVPAAVGRPTFNRLTIPEDGELVADAGGVYYIASKQSEAASDGSQLTTLTIGTVNLTGEHVTISPHTADATAESPTGYSWVSTGRAEDIGVSVIDNDIIIGTHKALADYGA